MKKLVLIKGAGDLASGIALRLHRCGYRIIMTDIPVPTTVRRTVAFSPAVYLGETKVEEVTGVLCRNAEEALRTAAARKVAVMVDPQAKIREELHPDVVVDAILAKYNLGTQITDAPIVIGVGPGFTAGVDCHCVVETKRGHYLGRCIWQGSAIPNTGIPGNIGGYTTERIIRAAADGIFRGNVAIGAQVKEGDIVGFCETDTASVPVPALIDGVVRGLLQDGVPVTAGLKSGDIDPRCAVEHCFTVSDKATSIGGGVLEAILTLSRRRSPVLVLLAAGNSVRFGSNKLLSVYREKPMYRHIVDQVELLSEDIFSEKLVVSQYPQILSDLSRQGYHAVENTAPEFGISHSIHLALDRISSFADRPQAICFAVCDQPELTAQTLRDLVEAWRSSGKSIGCLSHGGISGNPVIFDNRYVPELYALSGDVGGKCIVKAHPQEVCFHEIPDGAQLVDIDTPLKI
jgi:xanthine dehydrogenase accessory factor